MGNELKGKLILKDGSERILKKEVLKLIEKVFGVESYKKQATNCRCCIDRR